MKYSKLKSLPEIVARALKEDLGSGDVTTEALIGANQQAQAQLMAREAGIVAGAPCVEEVYRQLSPDIQVQWRASDGQKVKAGDVLALIDGPARELLAGERVALNFLGHLSGIATLTGKFVDAVAGTGVQILDTRKTTPLLRELEKYAVVVGGGVNHRRGLFDQMLIKDNHLAIFPQDDKDMPAGARVAAAVKRARERGQGLIEVEVDRLADVLPAAEAGADLILLDNFSPRDLMAAVDQVKDRVAGADKRPLLEASGGVSLATVGAIARTGVDRISVGALTHAAASLDVGLDFAGED